MTDLATRQAELVAALTASQAPEGFDTARLAVVSRTLIQKRARTAARVWPPLSTALGDRYAQRFADYARDNLLPVRGGAAADLGAFIRWLRKTRQLPDSVHLPSRFGKLLLILRRVAGIPTDFRRQ
jgi:hypothetical protein